MADEDFVVSLRIDLQGDIAKQVSSELERVNGQFTGFDGNVNKVQKSLDKAGGSGKSFAQSLSTTRYALYDVSSTLGIMGAALLGIAVGTEAVAIAWERDFANVVRTSGVVGAEVGKLRAQFVDLAQTLPASFADITKIGTLGAQLGIAQKDLTEFTKTVIQFSAATGISAEESAQAFGRLGNILGIGADQYDNLGSSIVKAGVSAVATESEIVAVAQQIGPIARLAGASASEVVGLATAFASVKIPPELARSVITKTFGDIQMAVAKASPKLEEFGKATGQSGKEFADAWSKDSTATFINLLQGIPKDANGAILALDGMGLASQRNTPALLKLAQNTDLVRKSLREAGTGFDENTELYRQFAIISETTSAKLQVLSNNFQAFLDAIGGANLGPIKDILDAVSGFLKIATDIVSTDVGGKLAGVVLAVTALGGVLAIVAGGVALFGASSIGMLQALEGISIIAPRATTALLGAGNAALLASGEMKAGALGASLLGKAIKALSLVGLVLLLPDIAGWIDNGVRGVNKLGSSFDDLKGRFLQSKYFNLIGDESLKGVGDMTDQVVSLSRALGGISSRGWQDIKELDETMAASAKSGNVKDVKDQLADLQDQWTKAGGKASGFKAAFVDTYAAIKDATNGAAGGTSGTDALNESLQETADDAQAAQDALDALRDAILNFGQSSISVEESQIRLSEAFNAMTDAAGAQGASLYGADAASLQLRQSYVDIDKAARDAAIALVENGNSVDEATAKYNEGREAIIQSRIAKGDDETAARAWADKILGTSAEAQAAIKAYADSYNQVPPKVETIIFANTSLAQDQVNAFIANVNRRVATITVNATNPAIGFGLGDGHATGGYISGPGTSTSDSIPARLSNGEYVIKASAVKSFGVGYFNALNQGRAPRHFASGGSVSSSGSSSGSSMIGGVIELGPKSLSAVQSSVINNIHIDDMAISRAAQRGDAKRRSTGEI